MDNPYLPYIVTELFCIAFSFDIFFRLSRRLDKEHGQADLEKMILSYILMLATDIFWACVQGRLLRPTRGLNAAVNALSLLSTAMGCFYWFTFVENRLHPAGTDWRGEKHVFSVPIIALCMLDLISAGTGWVFYIDPAGRYEEGRLFWAQGLITYLYLLVPTFHSLYCAAHTAARTKRREYLSYAGYIVVPSVLEFLTDAVETVPLFALSIFLVIQMLFLTLYLDQEYRLTRKERELTESRMAVMLSQIQPHFLYNTLTVIQDMCQDKAPEAAQTTVEFAEFLRGNLDSLSRKEPVPFEQELRHTQTYLALEQKRFGARLHVEYDIGADGFLLPALTLQPIAENAVQHGVSEREEGGTVRIVTAETKTAYTVTVLDDGVGFDTSAAPSDGRSHIGIANVSARLKAICGGTLEICSKPGTGTTAVITIPKEGQTR